MDQDVPFQVHVLHEALPTDLTEEPPLLVVESNVGIQRLLLSEALPAKTAGECTLPCVDLQVCLQIPALVEGFVTEAAGEWLLASVDPHVHLQCSLSREAFPADVAGVSEVSVGVQVSGKTGSGLVLVPAESTYAVLVLQVNCHMFHQQRFLVKRVTAHFADIGLCGAAKSLVGVLMGGCVSPQTVSLAKHFPTHVAGMNSLFAVVPYMPLQRCHVTEGATAFATLEWFLFDMDA